MGKESAIGLPIDGLPLAWDTMLWRSDDAHTTEECGDSLCGPVQPTVVVLDPEGNFWIVPSVEKPMGSAPAVLPHRRTALEPFPGITMYMLGLPVLRNADQRITGPGKKSGHSSNPIVEVVPVRL